MAPVASLEKLAKTRIGPVRYNSPMTQIAICGIVVFCTVGMFSAITNLGAGGQVDTQINDIANSVLYSLFALCGLVAGGINNILGPRLTIFLGTFGYALYIAGLWVNQATGSGVFLVVSGGVLGICAGLLWAAQGSIMMAYPLEKDKGKAFGIFWAIFQLGAVVGASITLGLSIHSTLPGVAVGTYVAFLIIIACGMLACQLLLPPNYVVRGDDTIVKVEARSNVGEEVVGMIRTLKDWRMVLLLPMFFASNWFYAYQGTANAKYFNGRTRALNALLEGFGAILGALFIGNGFLDSTWLGGRKRRGFIGLAITSALIIATWIPALVWQTGFTRFNCPACGDPTKPPLPSHALHDGTGFDLYDPGYAKHGAQYFFFYFSDAIYQAMAYWIMAALTNDPWQLARYAGLYKAVQSAGAAGSFGMDAVNTPLLNEHLSSWLMMLISLPLCGIVINTITETNYDHEKTVHVEELDYVPGLTAHGAVGDVERAKKVSHEGEHTTEPVPATKEKTPSVDEK